MTRDEIIKLAREAGFITGVTHASSGFHHPFVHPVAFATCLTELERFAALVAAAEREQCALTAWEVVEYEVHADLADQVAQAIRSRGQA